jgi:uncharacterized membrane protein YqjE
MAEETTRTGEGLLTSLKNLAATLIAIVHTRLELLSTDLEEGRERLISLLVMMFIALFCLCFGIVLLAILIVVVFWDTHRLLVLCTLTGMFLVAGGVLCGLAIRALKTMPRMFEASLGELSKDYQQIDTPQ